MWIVPAESIYWELSFEWSHLKVLFTRKWALFSNNTNFYAYNVLYKSFNVNGHTFRFHQRFWIWVSQLSLAHSCMLSYSVLKGLKSTDRLCKCLVSLECLTSSYNLCYTLPPQEFPVNRNLDWIMQMLWMSTWHFPTEVSIEERLGLSGNRHLMQIKRSRLYQSTIHNLKNKNN